MRPRQANLDEHFREANKIIQDSRFRWFLETFRSWQRVFLWGLQWISLNPTYCVSFWGRQVFNIRAPIFYIYDCIEPIKALFLNLKVYWVYDDMNHVQCVIKVFACWLCDMNMQLYIDALWTISSIDFKFISETVSIESSRSIIHIELKALYKRPSSNLEGICLHLVLVIFMSSYVHILKSFLYHVYI